MNTTNKGVRSIVYKAILYFILSGGFSYLFYFRYWKWRFCIEQALSSCVTSDGENLIAAGQFWIIPAIIFTSLGVRNLVKLYRLVKS